MPAKIRRNPAVKYYPKSLVSRGGLVHTFGSLATFLVLTFLCAGIYLLEDAFANPLAAEAAALIFGAFIIALATILLFYLLRPEHDAATSRRSQSRHTEFPPKKNLLAEFVVAVPDKHARGDLAYQRVYRDVSRIRL